MTHTPVSPDEHGLIIADDHPTGFTLEARRASAGEGWRWLGAGWRLFAQAPLRWLLALAISAALYVGVAMVPVLGTLLNVLIGPVLLAGLMALAHGIHEHDDRRLSLIFSGFRQHSGRLVLLGLLYLVLVLVALLITGVAAVALGMEQLPDGPLSSGQILRVVALALLFSALILPVSMAYWFAPMLVFFADMKPAQALRASLTASLRNWLSLLVYGLAALIAGFLVLLGGMVMAWLAKTAGGAALLVAAPFLIALGLLAYAVFTTSLYLAFRAMFAASDS